MKTTFFRVLEAEDKATALLEAIRSTEPMQSKVRFELDPFEFAAVPCSPFAYWTSARARALFASLPPFEAGERQPQRMMQPRVARRCGKRFTQDIFAILIPFQTPIEIG